MQKRIEKATGGVFYLRIAYFNLYSRVDRKRGTIVEEERHTRTVDNDTVSGHVSAVHLITHYAPRRRANCTCLQYRRQEEANKIHRRRAVNAFCLFLYTYTARPRGKHFFVQLNKICTPPCLKRNSRAFARRTVNVYFRSPIKIRSIAAPG